MLKATSCSTLLMLGLFVAMMTAQNVEKPREVIPLSELPAETNDITEMKRAVESQINALSPRMFEMNDWMYHNPEVGHEEVEAARMLSSELEANDFEVVFGVEGLDDAEYGVGNARKGWLEPEDLLNSMSAKDLLRWRASN